MTYESDARFNIVFQLKLRPSQAHPKPNAARRDLLRALRYWALPTVLLFFGLCRIGSKR